MDEKTIARFWAKVNKDGPEVRPGLGKCWLWTASLDKDGCGWFAFNGRIGRAHRASFAIHYDDPGTLAVRHTCGTPACVNPEHLSVGTLADNTPFMTARMLRRFWVHVDKSGPEARPRLGSCWLWTASAFSKSGYGYFYVDGSGIGAHRFSFALHYGDPGDLLVCHACDVRLCVRPDHLFIGTAADNLADMHAKGRHSFGDTHSLSKLTSADVREIRRLLGLGLAQREIAAQFGVHQAVISGIHTGRRWRHVSP